MTAEQRYSRCKTIEELNAEYKLDKMSAETFEYLDACEKAYEKRYTELWREKQQKMKEASNGTDN